MQNCLDAIMSKHSKESDEEGLQQVMTSAFTYTIKEIAKTVHDHDDLTTVGFQIVYNKKLDHMEILKITSINGKKVVLEPPVWISHYEYDPLSYDSSTDERIDILEIPAQMPDIQKQIEKIKGLPKP